MKQEKRVRSNKNKDNLKTITVLNNFKSQTSAVGVIDGIYWATYVDVVLVETRIRDHPIVARFHQWWEVVLVATFVESLTVHRIWTARQRRLNFEKVCFCFLPDKRWWFLTRCYCTVAQEIQSSAGAVWNCNNLIIFNMNNIFICKLFQHWAPIFCFLES